MKKRVVLTALLVCLFLFFGGIFFVSEIHAPTITTDIDTEEPFIQKDPLPYGETKLRIGETATYEGLKISLLSIEEDSRCPLDVQCIWAGVLRIRLETVSGMGTSTDVLSVGERITTEAHEITFISAFPDKSSAAAIAEAEYELTFSVKKRTADAIAPAQEVAPIAQKSCYVGGCSAQLCTDTPDVASTCEYKEEYACYKTAVCELQSSGECGWTHTSELHACLLSSQE
jgi:hypothetical protein